jgi:hypothetical protein
MASHEGSAVRRSHGVLRKPRACGGAYVFVEVRNMVKSLMLGASVTGDWQLLTRKGQVKKYY